MYPTNIINDIIFKSKVNFYELNKIYFDYVIVLLIYNIKKQ